MPDAYKFVFSGMLLAALLPAQTTQGIVSGRVYDARTQQPLSAVISYTNLSTNDTGSAHSDASGFYALVSLSPGTYRVRAEADRYQAQEIQDLTLFVAARLDLSFPLRPLDDVLDAGAGNILVLPQGDAVLPIIGPDLERGRSVAVRPLPLQQGTLYSTLSYVIDQQQIENLPLTGRDVYATLVMLPGVTAENATGRGLGFSVNGQRPSASNYLLDGVENNDYLVTGPLSVVAPESVQEYRISTGNFSAEYGRTSGFIANAVTRSGGNDWHGIGYFNLKNDALNANTFEHNAGLHENTGMFGSSLARTPLKEDQVGFQVGGPIRRGLLFHSSGLDYFRSRSFAEPTALPIPTTSFINDTVNSLPADSDARKLFDRFAPPPVISPGPAKATNFSPPVSINRILAFERIDFVPRKSTHRLTGRAAISRLSQPDFIWTPYKDFGSGLHVNTTSIALGWISSPRTKLSNELHASWSGSHLQWDRAHPEIPTLISSDAYLPGSPASYAYKNDSQTWEVLDNVVVPLGAHILKAGGGLLRRRIDGFLTLGQSGSFVFNDLKAFTQGEPQSFTVALDRQFPSRLPQYDRRYSYQQYSLFAEDSYKVSRRLKLNYGVRYENFGSPYNTGQVKDYELRFGSGSGIVQGIRDATFVFPGSGREKLYDADDNDWSVRLGFAYSLDRDSRTLLRGAYGIFYDRSFDNLWENLRNNNVVLGTASAISGKIDFLAPIPDLLKGLQFPYPRKDYLMTYQPGIQNGYIQSYFLGVQYQATANLLLDLTGTGSAGRKLITTDVINRPYSLPTASYNAIGSYNTDIGEISYRSNQGVSNYNALIVLARYRARRGQFQASYTWGHSIDNQSDPLAGEFFNLDFTHLGSISTNNATAVFSRQFDSRIDRANSDFDQRHNLVFLSTWELPAALRSSKAAPFFRGWRISQLAAVRSGLPFSVFANVGGAPLSGGSLLPIPRADMTDPRQATLDAAVQGGRRLLNRDAFQAPGPGVQGNTGRNEFAGPGLFNVDLSLSRSFSLPWLGESAKLTVRADIQDLLNHSNLNNPTITLIDSPDFGIAHFGRTGRSTGFPAIAPLNETARQVQLMLRIQF